MIALRILIVSSIESVFLAELEAETIINALISLNSRFTEGRPHTHTI